MRILVCFLIFGITLDGWAAHPPLLPAPQQVAWTGKSVAIKGMINVVAHSPGSESVADSIQHFIKMVGGRSVQLTSQSASKSAFVITVMLDTDLPALRQNQEGYQLLVSPTQIELKAQTTTGLFWGYRTLQQLTDVESKSIAGCTIVDFPAFPIRGSCTMWVVVLFRLKRSNGTSIGFPIIKSIRFTGT
ncbi:hypothetical protein GO730_37740 [Spirosoma sp. HMF3257]|uniref:beta-N-acetylhexosaminidase n=1 Tax=Spirosoma telluris TaxID=2183553 RepID=A0A327NG12_9BACT|nr:hypothetical protein [Spirosoma telluris]RAI73199.1 hypothetical protein HMF3257_37650 [Spirosoma telluris]